VSVAASIVDPVTFLKRLRTRREDAHRVLGQVTAVLAEYAGALVAAGATVIAVGDPTATVEILGPQLFQESPSATSTISSARFTPWPRR